MTTSQFVVGGILLSAAALATAQAGKSTDADLERDKMVVTAHCGYCHTFGKGEPAGQGPNLFGVVGQPAGIRAGFNYSGPFLKALKGEKWTQKQLDTWITDTQLMVPGTGMTYFQDDVQTRQVIVRFLESLK